jgi:general secretion pathway protein D
VPDERQQLSITVDLRTNSLLVSGSEEYLERVSEIIRQLDSQVGTEREQITYELKNARVEEVATAMQQFIQIEQDRIARLLGPDRSGSLIRRLEREISVVGVPGSSRLILSASPRYMERVRTLIDELDTPPKQVLIQVLLAEVTLDDDDDFGVDWSFDGVGSRDYGASSTALGTPLLTSLGVPNLSVTSLDFEVLIRALQVQSRLEVLSRPQILVNDNQIANIRVGEEIQLVQNVERLDDGRTVSDVTPRELGVILQVEPSISPDNYVRLDISPEISALTQRTTQVSSDFEAPVISTRRADTTVTVRDGETIVIGGLIQSSVSLRTSKVPLLGDIPAIGEVFKSREETSTKTELLIILTPRVIVNPEDIRRYSDIEIDRLTLPDSTKDSLRRNDVGVDSGLSAEGAEAPSDLEQPYGDVPPSPRRETGGQGDDGEELEGFELPL